MLHRTVDRTSIATLIFRDNSGACLAIEGLLRGRGDCGARKIPPGISQGILRNFLREAALSGDRRGRFSLLQPKVCKRHLATLKPMFGYMLKHENFKNKGARLAC